MKSRRILAYLDLYDTFITRDLNNFVLSLVKFEKPKRFGDPVKEVSQTPSQRKYYRRLSDTAHTLLLKTAAKALQEFKNAE